MSVLGSLLFCLYLLPLGPIIRKHGMPLHCNTDDSQIYMPLKKNETVRPLLECVEYIKAWMALHKLFTFQCMKDRSNGTPLVDVGALTQYTKPTIET